MTVSLRRFMTARIGVASILLVAWTGALCVLHAWWVRAFVLNIPPAWDHALYLFLSLRFRHALADVGLAGLAQELFLRKATVAPLLPLASVPLYPTLGETPAVAYSTLGLFLLVLLIGVFLLAREEPVPSPLVELQRGRIVARVQAGRSATALLAVLIVSTFSGIVNFSREYLMDFPSVAVATVGLYCLWRSEGLTRHRWAIAAGAGLALSALTKIMSGYLFLGPVALTFFMGRKRSGLAGLGLFLLTTGVVAAPWYVPHVTDVAHYLTYYGYGEGSLPYRSGGASIASASNLTYYFYALLFEAIGPLVTLLMGLPFLLASLARRKRSPSALDTFLLVWLVSGYAILTLVPNKGGERYALGLLPPLAVLAARAAVTNRLKMLAGAVAILNLVLLTWPTPLAGWVHAHFDGFPHSGTLVRGDWPVDDVLRALANPAFRQRPRPDAASDADYVRDAYRALLRREPDPSGFGAYLNALQSGALTREAVYKSIASSQECRSRPLQVLVVPDHRAVNASTLNYLGEVERLPFHFVHVSSVEEWSGRTWAFDAALVKDGGEQGPAHEVGAVDAIEQDLRDTSVPSGTWMCPDGSRLRLLRPAPLRAIGQIPSRLDAPAPKVASGRAPVQLQRSNRVD